MDWRSRVGAVLLAMVLVALLATSIVIPMLLRRAARDDEDFLRVLNERPEPTAPVLDGARYDDALNRLGDEPRITNASQRHMFAPEIRFRCESCNAPLSEELVATLCPCCGLWRGPGLQEEYEERVSSCREFIAGSERITLVLRPEFGNAKRTYPRVEMMLTDSNQVAEITSLVGLVPRSPCDCFPNQGMIFRRGDRQLRVSVSRDHFYVSDDVSKPGRKASVQLLFRMPPRLWEVFERHLREYRDRNREPVQEGASQSDPDWAWRW